MSIDTAFPSRVDEPAVVRRPRRLVGLVLGFALTGCIPCAGSVPANYVYLGQDRQALHRVACLDGSVFAGAQVAYTWKSLEPEEDRYDFSAIEADLAYLNRKGKQLFAQLQDVSFYEQYMPIPRYLRTPAFGGGADRQYSFANDRDAKAKPAGWVVRRWDARVAERFHRLLAALGKAFDGRIAGLNLPETAVDFGSTGRYFPKGFTPEAYAKAVMANMKAARAAFPKSVVIQYANFMPGEWLPSDDKGYLKSVFAYGASTGVGLGGPDVKVWRKNQMAHSYALLPGLRGEVPTGIAVQDGNYSEINPKTNRQVTVAEIYHFAADHLQVDYLFWCTQEPYFKRDVVPYLERLLRGE
jgi:hypothetical protein